MDEYKCPYSAPLITHQFGCVLAQEVIHRGGTEIICKQAAAQQRCMRLFQSLKAAALPAFGVEDDLLSMPHSVLVKIQYGGLLAIQSLLGAGPASGAGVENIDHLLAEAQAKWGDFGDIPQEPLVATITAFKPRSRRG